MPISARRMTVDLAKSRVKTHGFKSKESIQTEGPTRITEITTKEIYLISKLFRSKMRLSS